MSNLQHSTAGHNGHGAGSPSHRADAAALQADIARQRAALAETVQDLHERLDVKTRAQEKVAEIRQRPQVAVGGVGVVLAVVGLVVWRRRKQAR